MENYIKAELGSRKLRKKHIVCLMRIVEVYDCNSKCSQHIASYKCTDNFLVSSRGVEESVSQE